MRSILCGFTSCSVFGLKAKSTNDLLVEKLYQGFSGSLLGYQLPSAYFGKMDQDRSSCVAIHYMSIRGSICIVTPPCSIVTASQQSLSDSTTTQKHREEAIGACETKYSPYIHIIHIILQCYCTILPIYVMNSMNCGINWYWKRFPHLKDLQSISVLWPCSKTVPARAACTGASTNRNRIAAMAVEQRKKPALVSRILPRLPRFVKIDAESPNQSYQNVSDLSNEWSISLGSTNSQGRTHSHRNRLGLAGKWTNSPSMPLMPVSVMAKVELERAYCQNFHTAPSSWES